MEKAHGLHLHPPRRRAGAQHDKGSREVQSAVQQKGSDESFFNRGPGRTSQTRKHGERTRDGDPRIPGPLVQVEKRARGGGAGPGGGGLLKQPRDRESCRASFRLDHGENGAERDAESRHEGMKQGRGTKQKRGDHRAAAQNGFHREQNAVCGEEARVKVLISQNETRLGDGRGQHDRDKGRACPTGACLRETQRGDAPQSRQQRVQARELEQQDCCT